MHVFNTLRLNWNIYKVTRFKKWVSVLSKHNILRKEESLSQNKIFIAK